MQAPSKLFTTEIACARDGILAMQAPSKLFTTEIACAREIIPAAQSLFFCCLVPGVSGPPGHLIKPGTN